MSRVMDAVGSVIMAVTAVVLLAFYVGDRDMAPKAVERRIISGWEEANHWGIRIGTLDAQVVITEFVDYQCPFCKRIAPSLDSILTEHPEEVALVLQHWPLPIHTEAETAAIAVECAERQGRVREFVSVLYSKQDSLGMRPWEAYARDAGMPDSAAFQRCVGLPSDSFPRIAAGVGLAGKYEATGTPTFWVNGRVTPSNQVRLAVEELLGSRQGR